MWIISLHNFEGSSLEASEPARVLGPFQEKEVALTIADEIQDLLGHMMPDHEFLTHVSEVITAASFNVLEDNLKDVENFIIEKYDIQDW